MWPRRGREACASASAALAFVLSWLWQEASQMLCLTSVPRMHPLYRAVLCLGCARGSQGCVWAISREEPAVPAWGLLQEGAASRAGLSSCSEMVSDDQRDQEPQQHRGLQSSIGHCRESPQGPPVEIPLGAPPRGALLPSRDVRLPCSTGWEPRCPFCTPRKAPELRGKAPGGSAPPGPTGRSGQQ